MKQLGHPTFTATFTPTHLRETAFIFSLLPFLSFLKEVTGWIGLPSPVELDANGGGQYKPRPRNGLRPQKRLQSKHSAAAWSEVPQAKTRACAEPLPAT